MTKASIRRCRACERESRHATRASLTPTDLNRIHSLSNNEDKFYTDWEESFDSFDQMNLHENLLRGIYAYGELSTRWDELSA